MSLRWCTSLLVAVLGFSLVGCGKRETRIEYGLHHQILHLVRGAEPQELDPHVITGQTEHQILMSLLEGLVADDPHDLHPVPGVAERWEMSPDGTVYTFHLRQAAKWSNGEPVLAKDFLESYRRALAPALAYQYAYMLYAVKNAEAYNVGKLTNFAEVGFAVLDDYTFRVTLESPTPYFLSLLSHMSWFPLHMTSIARHGDPFARTTVWTRPGDFVGNGPFLLSEWKVNYRIVVKKNPNYWDATNVHLNEIHFYAVENQDAEERAFRAGQLHIGYQFASAKIERYRRDHPEVLKIEPHLANYFYRINVTKSPLNDKRVRQALNYSIDRESIVNNIMRGGQMPASSFVPPGTAGYTSRTSVPYDVVRARRLLAEAGYPGGSNLPPVEILYNTMDDHRRIAEAIQQMWKQTLGVDARLVNQEWKVYLASLHALDYQVSRGGWIGDYVDPNTFLDCFLTGGGNNETGWSHTEYDRLIKQAARTNERTQRYELFHRAEAILLDELPFIPLYYYTRVYLRHPDVKGWYPTLTDNHPYKGIKLERSASSK